MSEYVNDGLDGVDDFDIPADEETAFGSVPHGNMNINDDNNETVPKQGFNNNNNGNTTNGLKPGILNYYSQYFASTQFIERSKQTLMNKDLGSIEDLYGFVWIIMSCALMKMISKTFYELIAKQVFHGERISANPSKNINLMFHTLWIFIIFDMVGSLIISYRLTAGQNKYVSILSVFGYGNINWLVLFPLVDLIRYVLSGRMVEKVITWVITSILVLKITHFLTIQQSWNIEFPDRIIMLVTEALKMVAINFIL
ncbi:protein Yip5p [Monosporozyma unispora]|nr:hypothetical protein C6P44_004371 [Kazachstania unispora]